MYMAYNIQWLIYELCHVIFVLTSIQFSSIYAEILPVIQFFPTRSEKMTVNNWMSGVANRTQRHVNNQT